MSIHKLIYILSSLSILFLLSCSTEKPAEVSSQKPSEVGSSGVSGTSQQPVSVGEGIFSLEITPSDASRNSIIYIIPKGFNPTNAKIEWLVNGKLTSNPAAIQFNAVETRKGDKVQVRATVNGREALSNVVQIKNTSPEVNKVRILPEVVWKPGDSLSVEVSGTDIDGDEVTISYEWTKNGEPAGNGKRIEVPLKRGDKVSVKITPFDGEVYGRSVILHREIRNLPPMIIDDKKFNFDGKVYSYQVKATDPDGDPLTYSLKTAPAGMTIEQLTGLIRWNVPPDFKGKTTFTVFVNDGHGGEAMQSLTFAITPEKK
ncbi:MAG: Ig-like domain-containing protein [Nitrospirae bacterium]|nr:Ig-like domain-containing protein [Nitrospirota bacterium]